MGQIWKCTSKIWGFLPIKRGVPKLPIFVWFYDHDLRANVFGTKRAKCKPKKIKLRTVPTFPKIWQNLAQNGWDYVDHFTRSLQSSHGSQGSHQLATVRLAILRLVYTALTGLWLNFRTALRRGGKGKKRKKKGEKKRKREGRKRNKKGKHAETPVQLYPEPLNPGCVTCL